MIETELSYDDYRWVPIGSTLLCDAECEDMEHDHGDRGWFDPYSDWEGSWDESCSEYGVELDEWREQFQPGIVVDERGCS